MAFENNNFKVVKKSSLQKSEQSLSCKISADGEIAKVFAVSINPICENQEISNGLISFNGHLDICMVYQLESGEVGSAFSSCPFSSKFEDESITNGEKAIINLNVIDHTIESISNNDVIVGVTLEQSGLLIQNIEINSISSSDQDVCLKEDEINVVRFVGSGKLNASETMQYSSRDKIKKVLGSESCAIVKNVEAGVNFVSVSGDIVTKVLFIDENDKFDSAQIFDSFKEEIEIDGVNRENFAEALTRVDINSVKIDLEDDEKGSKISVQIPLIIEAFAYEEIPISIVSDLYSTKCDMEIVTESFEMSKLFNVEFLEGKVDGSVMLDEDQPRVDKILFNFASCAQVTNAYVADGELSVDGIAKTTVVYLNDENSSLNAVEIEIPFSISDKTKATDQSTLLANAFLTDVDIAIKKGREIIFDGKIKAVVNVNDDEVSAVISDVKAGDEYGERDCAMQLVFAKAGDTLWEVAKMNKVQESLIISQNPDVSFPLQENKDIVIFYQNK